ncbi:DUF6493 family protein [Spirillospora sp. NBC_01491]|uniref:DUF6493 family protein n=1 Tax=Spirillospora sp. NBC_01491 TaxID=2976007 RepID=UPI002E2F9EDE|nr:DUF6493 family protein [Spirillospora sp. NBC_01491]
MSSLTQQRDLTDAWNETAARIDAHDADGVAEFVRGLDDDERREVARRLPELLRSAAPRGPRPFMGDDAAFRAAGAGTLGGAAAVAAWLNRREFTSRWAGEHDDTGRLLDLWDDRDDAWRTDLARRLVLRLRSPRHIGLDLALALLAETGAEPPEHDPLVVGWVSTAPPRAKDPMLPVLLPRIFEAEGVGRALRGNTSWLRTLATLADRGAVDRRALLDGCVRRFLRGGTATDLRFFVSLHRLLEPADLDARRRHVRRHARDYVRLLPSAPGPVAELAAGLLRELPDLKPEYVVEALDGLLFRGEVGLVRGGLAWLESTVRRSPELADGCAAALARAFGHTSPGVRRRAVRLALKLPDTTAPDALRDAVPLLPDDLAAQLTARYAPPGPPAA